jgi:hypothetical protein
MKIKEHIIKIQDIWFDKLISKIIHYI